MDEDFRVLGNQKKHSTEAVGKRVQHLLKTAPPMIHPEGVVALNPGYFLLQHLRKYEKPKAIKLQEI